MAHIQWKERYNINYKEVDAQHKRLLDVLNHLLDLIECKRPPDEITGIFQRLCTYALDHFSLEERYLESCGYPEAARQKAEHEFFVSRILEFNDRYDPSEPELLQETFHFLKTWYLGHILRTDMEYVPWVRRYYREARIQAVIVDFEGILSATAPRILIARLASLCGKPEDELERIVFGESLYSDLQTGALDATQFLTELSQRVGTPLDADPVTDALAAMSTPIEDSLDLIRDLKSSHKLALVVNSHPWHAEHALRSCPVLERFDAVSLSHEARSLVPDHRILSDALDKLGLMSEECLFLTRSPQRAEEADRQLLHGHVLMDESALRRRLESKAL